jgi:hypothetical protein
MIDRTLIECQPIEFNLGTIRQGAPISSFNLHGQATVAALHARSNKAFPCRTTLSPRTAHLEIFAVRFPGKVKRNPRSTAAQVGH